MNLKMEAVYFSKKLVNAYQALTIYHYNIVINIVAVLDGNGKR